MEKKRFEYRNMVLETKLIDINMNERVKNSQEEEYFEKVYQDMIKETKDIIFKECSKVNFS